MASIGEKLREQRLKKKLSPQRVYETLKIHPRILEALEGDKGDEALSPIYIKGFLKKYSQYLNLDTDSIMEEYERLHPKTPSTILSIEKEKKLKIDYHRLLSIFKIVLIVILTVLFIGYMRFVLRSLSQNQTRPEATLERVKTAEEDELSLLVPRDQPLILTIRAKRGSWMQVKSDGRIIFEDVLSKGKEEKWTAKEKIELWVGNAEGLNLFLNGKELGSPGKGVIKGILITREGMKVK